MFEFYNGALKEVQYERSQLLALTSDTKTVLESKVIEVKPGFSTETVLVFSEKGNESFGSRPSDLVVKFEQEPHDSFVRKGDDLIYTHKLTLEDALMSQTVAVKTLDSRTVQVCPDEVISPDTRLVVKGEGMPVGLTGKVFADTKTQLVPV